MRICIVLVLLLLSTVAYAQEGPLAQGAGTHALNMEIVTPKSNTPFGTVRATLYDDAGHPSVWVLPVPHRTADRAFWAATVGSFASAVADVENSQAAMRANPYGRELNPIFFSHRPTRSRMYEVALPLTMLETYLSYRQKRKEDAEAAFGVRVPRPHWWVYHAVTIGSHTFGTIFTIASTGR